MRVDLPAPFWPTRAMISPGSTSSEAAFSAWTPEKCLSMPRIDKTGVPAGLWSIRNRRERFRPRCERKPELSVGRRQGLGRVARIVEVVDVLDIGRNLLPVRILFHHFEGLGPEARIALAGGTELAVDDRLER